MGDYTFNKTKNVSIADAEAFEKALYTAAGMVPEDAERVGKILVEADARGVYSHGIQRNHIYLERFRRGGTDPKGCPETGEAIDYSLLLVNKHQCQGCKYFAFQECETLANQQDQRVNESASIAIK